MRNICVCMCKDSLVCSIHSFSLNVHHRLCMVEWAEWERVGFGSGGSHKNDDDHT